MDHRIKMDKDKLAKILKALGHVNRIRIIDNLSIGGVKTPTYLSGILKLSLPLTLHHLSILEHAKIIKKERLHQFTIYTLNQDNFKEIILWLKSRL